MHVLRFIGRLRAGAVKAMPRVLSVHGMLQAERDLADKRAPAAQAFTRSVNADTVRTREFIEGGYLS
jgi:hypothetical protein